MKKECRSCNQTKDQSAFHRNTHMKSGFLNQCKECAKGRKRDLPKEERMKKNAEAIRRYNEKHPEKVAEIKRKYKLENREKTLASAAVARALAKGKLIREPCEVCGELKVHAHHESYEKEDRLNVRWLCAKCHSDHHWKEKEREVENVTQ